MIDMNSGEKKKVYGYRRVSTEEQVEGISLQNQELAIKTYADQHNLEVVEIFSDEGFSAKTARRPALQIMLKLLASKDSDVKGIIVYNLSRISRDMESFFRDIGYHLSARAVHLYSTSENIDDTAQGRLMRNISLTMHQYDNDVKSQTVKDNMHLVALEGWWQGSIPHGYMREKVAIGEKTRDGKVKERLTLVPDTDNKVGQKVRMVLERFSKGDITQSELAQYAEAIKLKSATGTGFAPQSIKNMLTNVTYAGFVCNAMTNYEPVKGKHEGLISLDTYNRNQAILDGRKPADTSMPRFTADYPLKHSLLCTNCLKSLTGSAPTTGSGSRSPRYHCTRCTGLGSKSTSRTDELFEAFLNDITPTDALIKLFRTIVSRIASEKLTDLNERVSALRSKMSVIDSNIQKALQAFLDNEISRLEKEDYQNKLRQQRIELEGEINTLEDLQRLNEATIEYVCNFIKAPARMWLDADPAIKVEFQRMVSENGIVFDLKSEKFGTTGLSPFYRLKDTIKDSEEPLNSSMVILRRVELRLPG